MQTFFTTLGTKQSIRCATDTRRKCCRTNMACKKAAKGARPRPHRSSPCRPSRNPGRAVLKLASGTFWGGCQNVPTAPLATLAQQISLSMLAEMPARGSRSVHTTRKA